MEQPFCRRLVMGWGVVYQACRHKTDNFLFQPFGERRCYQAFVYAFHGPKSSHNILVVRLFKPQLFLLMFYGS